MVNMYTVYDKVAKTYCNPLFTDNKEGHNLAIRMIKAQMYDPHNMIAMFPDNYELWFLGEYDEETADFIVVEPEKVIDCEKALKELREERNV